MSTSNHKTYLITGASRGIGAETAKHLASLGHRVVLAARSTASLTTLVREIEAAGGSALAIAGDVAKFDDMRRAVDQTLATYGALDVLVNNAGLIDPISRLESSDPEAWGRIIDVNLKGVYHGVRAALPPMLAQGSGTVVNLSSGAATSALEGWSHYCASKAAVLSLTKCVHREVFDQGIVCVGLSPGTVATQMQTLIRASGVNPVSQLDPTAHIPPLWVAKAIAFLAGPKGKTYAGSDFSLKTDAGRQAVGLPNL